MIGLKVLKKKFELQTDRLTDKVNYRGLMGVTAYKE